MNKTSKQIQGDIYQLLIDSNLASELTGSVYRRGYRPRSSRKEDAIVIFTTGLAGQVQTGVVTINIYVPDIDPYNNGVYVEDGARIEYLEVKAQEWVEDIRFQTSEYKFQLQQTIYTEYEPEINQHFVVIKLGYKLCND